MKTTCQVCIFRLNNEYGKQNGCYANKANNFYINDDHYIINDYCNTCRNETWYYIRDNPDLSKDELLNRIKYENKMNYSVSLIHNSDIITDDLYFTLESISKLDVAPKKVFIITKLNILDASHLYSESLRRFPNLSIKVDITTEELTYNCLVCKGIRFTADSQYMLTINSGYDILNETINRLNNNIVNNSQYFNIFLCGDFYIINQQLAEKLAILKLDESTTLEKLALDYMIENDKE